MTNILSGYSMNISADDLLDPATAATRLEMYLAELASYGYRKEIRIICTPDWGPFILQHWAPVIERHGFEVLVILGQERRDSADIAEQACAWARHVLPIIRHRLSGIQIVNEASKWFSPTAYVAWHKQMASVIRACAPGVPIVTGDITAEKNDPNGHGWWREVVTAGLRISTPGTWDGDYEVLSLHLQRMNKDSEAARIVRMIDEVYGGSARIWITESQYGQGPWLARLRPTVERVFPYSWNVKGSECMRHGGPLA